MDPGVQLIWPLGSSGHQMRGYMSHSLWPKQIATTIRWQRQGWGRESLLPQGVGQDQWVDLVRALQPCRTECQPYFLDHPPPPSWVSWRVLGRRLRSDSYLTLPYDHHSTVGWIPSLTATPWHYVACGRGPLGHQPRTRWNHCLVTWCGVVLHSNDWMVRAVLTVLCYNSPLLFDASQSWG